MSVVGQKLGEAGTLLALEDVSRISHDAPGLARLVDNAVEVHGLKWTTQIVGVVANRAGNVQLCQEELRKKHRGILKSRSVLHQLALLIGDFVNEKKDDAMFGYIALEIVCERVERFANGPLLRERLDEWMRLRGVTRQPMIFSGTWWYGIAAACVTTQAAW
jgi:hypothetical protein